MDRVEEGVANFRTFQSDARDFFSRHDEREQVTAEIEARRHRENSTKINIILAITAIATVVVMTVGIYISVEVSKHSMVDPLKIFGARLHDKVYAITQKPLDAGNSEIYTATVR